MISLGGIYAQSLEEKVDLWRFMQCESITDFERSCHFLKNHSYWPLEKSSQQHLENFVLKNANNLSQGQICGFFDFFSPCSARAQFFFIGFLYGQGKKEAARRFLASSWSTLDLTSQQQQAIAKRFSLLLRFQNRYRFINLLLKGKTTLAKELIAYLPTKEKDWALVCLAYASPNPRKHRVADQSFKDLSKRDQKDPFLIFLRLRSFQKHGLAVQTKFIKCLWNHNIPGAAEILRNKGCFWKKRTFQHAQEALNHLRKKSNGPMAYIYFFEKMKKILPLEDVLKDFKALCGAWNKGLEKENKPEKKQKKQKNLQKRPLSKEGKQSLPFSFLLDSKRCLNLWWEILKPLLIDLAQYRVNDWASSLVLGIPSNDQRPTVALHQQWAIIALKKMKNPWLALEIFSKINLKDLDPSQKAGIFYWTGRCHEALGRNKLACAYDKKAQALPLTFYGQIVYCKTLQNQSHKILKKKGHQNLWDRHSKPLLFIKKRWLSEEAISLPSQVRELAHCACLVSKLGKNFRFLAISLAKAGLSYINHRFSNHPSKEHYLKGFLQTIRPDLSDHLVVLMAEHCVLSRSFIPIEAYPVLPKLPQNGLGLDPALIHAIIYCESHFRSNVLSYDKGKGLMQLMDPSIEVEMRALKINNKDANVYSWDLNVLLGCSVLRRYLRLFNQNIILAIAAYNAGPGNVKRWLAERPLGSNNPASPESLEWIENIPYCITRVYVKKVLAHLMIYRFLLKQKPRPVNR
jgi:tetratricopeptide (TPR) repeat protein